MQMQDFLGWLRVMRPLLCQVGWCGYMLKLMADSTGRMMMLMSGRLFMRMGLFVLGCGRMQYT